MKNYSLKTIVIFLIIIVVLVQKSFGFNEAEIIVPIEDEYDIDINCVRYSPDGKYIATSNSNKTVSLLETSSGKHLKTFQGHSSDVISVNFSPDGQKIVSGGYDKIIKIWDVDTGKLIRNLEGHSDCIRSVCFSPDGKSIASGSDDTTIKFWKVTTGELLRTIKGHRYSVWSISFNPNGQYIASGSFDDTVKLWEISTGKLIRNFLGHSSDVWSVCFSPDGHYIASSSYDKTIKIWEVTSGLVFKNFDFKDNYGFYKSVTFNPGGSLIATGNSFQVIKVINIKTGKHLKTIDGFSSYSALSVNFSPDGQHIISCSAEGLVKIWDLNSGDLIKKIDGNCPSVCSVTFSPDARHIVSGSSDSTIKLWDISLHKLIYTIKGNRIHRGEEDYITFSPDGRYIASISDYDSINIWEVKSRKILRTIKCNASRHICFSPNSRSIAFQNNRNAINFIDVESGELTRKFRGNFNFFDSLSFSPNGRHVACGSIDGNIYVWEVRSGILIKILKGHSYRVYAVNFTPDSHRIVSGGFDNTIKLWDVGSGKLIQSFMGHKYAVQSLECSQNGQIIVSGSEDNTVRLWDIKSGKNLRTLKGHTDVVSSVSLGPNGQRIVSAGDNTIRLWDINSDQATEIIHFLPFNEWIITKPGSLSYTASEKGAEFAYVRLNSNDNELIPLTEYQTKHSEIKPLKEPLEKSSDIFLQLEHSNNVNVNSVCDSQDGKPLTDFRSKNKTDALIATKSFPITKQSPKINICKPSNNHHTKKSYILVHVKMDGVSSAIQDIKLYVNNQPINIQEATPEIMNPFGESIRKYYVSLPVENNFIRVVATNNDNLTSFDKIKIIREKTDTIIPEGKLYLISVGVNHLEYIHQNDLDYAAKDAIDMVNLLKSMKGILYENIEFFVFSDLSDQMPDSKNIISCLKQLLLLATKKKDTVMIFLAGHGISTKDNGYIFLTRDARMSGSGSYDMQTVLKWGDITHALKSLTCQKKILILDTCYSSGVNVDSLIIDGNKSKTIVFSSTSGKQLASECKQFQNGCFTYAIKNACGKDLPADIIKDGKIDISELKISVENQLKKLSYDQKPDFCMPQGGSNFIFYAKP